MKRITLLVLAFALVLSGALAASAERVKGAGGAGLEFNAKGSWRMAFDYLDNELDFNSDDTSASEQDFNAELRARTWFEFIASENVKAVLGTEIGNAYFGSGALAVGGDAVAIKVKHAYLEFKLPSTSVTVRSGLQYVQTPGNLGSLVFADDVAATMLIVPFNDMLSLTTGWMRTDNPSTTNKSDEVDVFPVILNITTPMVSAQPYFVYGNLGKDAVADARQVSKAWWFGAAAQIKPMDNLAIMLDAVYGDLKTQIDRQDATGGGASLAVDFTLPTVTPELFALYFTGENEDVTDGSERMYARSVDNYGPTSFGLAGSNFSTDSYLAIAATGPGGTANFTPAGIGMWAVGLKAKDLSFNKGLSHTISLMYARGTNHKDYVDDHATVDQATLTTKDSLIEFNFDTTYKLYDQLSAIVELGYLKLNYNDDLGTRGDDYVSDPAIKAVVGFVYDF